MLSKELFKFVVHNRVPFFCVPGGRECLFEVLLQGFLGLSPALLVHLSFGQHLAKIKDKIEFQPEEKKFIILTIIV